MRLLSENSEILTSNFHVPYSDLIDGILVNWKGFYVAALSLEPFDIECSDKTELDRIGQSIKRLLNEFSADFTYKLTIQNFIETGLSRRRFSLWIEYNSKIKTLSVPFLKTIQTLETIEETELQALKTLREEQLRILEASKQVGISALVAGNQQVLQLLSGFFIPERTSGNNHLSSLRQADLLIKDNSFFYDHIYWGGLSIAEYPDEVFTGQFRDATLTNSNSFTCVSIKPRDSQKIINQLKNKRKVSASLTNTQSRLRDLESEARLKSEDELLESLVVGQEKVYECQISSFTSGLDQNFVNFQLNKFSDNLKSNGFQVYKEAIALYPIFNSCLPGGQIESSRSQLLPSSCVQAIFPIFDIDKGHPKNVLTFKDRTDSLVTIDPWDSSLPSYNAVISGTSGSGKSFLSNVILKRLSEDPMLKTFIIEIGGSYRRLTEVKGGQFFTFDLSGENGFNPLGGVQLNDPASLEAACEIICTIIGDKNKGISKLHRSLILKELTETLKAVGSLTLSILKEQWAKSDELFFIDAAKILYGWTGDRPFGRLLDNNKTLKAQSHWSCFDLKGLNDYPELQRVVMLAIVKRVWELVRSSNDKKILLLDEVWALVQENSAFIGEAFRTFRKHNASAIAVTQSIEDIATEGLISAVLNNAPTKIVLKQSLKPERLQKLLDLNSRELEIVGSLRSVKGEFSEFFMINGDKRRCLKLVPSADDYWLSTTNPTDIDFIKLFLSKRPELTELQGCHEIANLYGRKRP